MVTVKRRRFLSVVTSLIVLFVVGLLAWPLPDAPRSVWEGESAGGPDTSRSVYWVGHSLLNSRDEAAVVPRNVIESTGDIAESLGLRYRGFDHTLWGSPLSLAYRGRPHAYEREELEHAARLSELHDRGDQYDSLVLIDTVPVDAARRYEHTEYYVARFRCDHLARRPDARTYLYEGWVNFQGLSDPDQPGEAASWDWPERMRLEQDGYTTVAARVSIGAFAPPGFLGRLSRWLPSERVCPSREPVFVVPVATAMLALHDQLNQTGHDWRFEGRPMRTADLFVNPYVRWPEDWPRNDLDESTVQSTLARLPRRRPGEPLDDIHPSVLGTYLVALVHFSTLYRRSAEGAASIEGLADIDARRLQRLVWEVVSTDERAGVR